MTMAPETAAIIGLALGAACRTLYPWLRKLQAAADQGQVLRFELRYLLSAMISVLICVFGVVLYLPQFQLPAANVFPLAFASGWASTDIFNSLAK